MSINSQRLVSAAKCTEVLNILNLEKSDLKYRQKTLEKQVAETDLTVEDNTVAISQLTFELETIQNALPNIPDGPEKLDLMMRVNDIENELMDLETESQVKGIVLRLRRESNLTITGVYLVGNGEDIGIVEARLAEVSA